jgi:hypothetical protein
MKVPQELQDNALREPYGDILQEISPEINRSAYVQHLTSRQEQAQAGTLGFANLSVLDCLTNYVTWGRDASSVILVSSSDIVETPPSKVLKSNNSLLIVNYYGSSWDSITEGAPTWECGYSNNFSCVRPETWAGNASAVSGWNVYGYKIDYCLSHTVNLEGKCSIRFEVPILISTLYRLQLL